MIFEVLNLALHLLKHQQCSIIVVLALIVHQRLLTDPILHPKKPLGWDQAQCRAVGS